MGEDVFAEVFSGNRILWDGALQVVMPVINSVIGPGNWETAVLFRGEVVHREERWDQLKGVVDPVLTHG